MLWIAVLGEDRLEKGLFELLHGLEGRIVHDRALEVAAVAFDEIQVRRIARVPDNAHALAANSDG